MIKRLLQRKIVQSLRIFPVVGLIGSRQAGKTTLARAIAATRKKAVYLDLERPSDLAKLGEPELFLEQFSGRLVILDEIQRMPELFPVLRALVDSERKKGRFLILGSATPALVRQASESLAGRIIYHELPPLMFSEVGSKDFRKLWYRGGYPDS